jgi:hypothetical protein
MAYTTLSSPARGANSKKKIRSELVADAAQHAEWRLTLFALLNASAKVFAKFSLTAIVPLLTLQI